MGNNVTQEMQKLGFHPVNLFALMNGVTGSLGQVVQAIFSWIYFLAEIGILVGALVFLVGAGFHHAKVKGSGARIVVWSVAGFVIAVVMPGVVLAIDSGLH
ncbi:MAG: hypothetical protein ACYCYO_00110 [Bacilli bacterium]